MYTIRCDLPKNREPWSTSLDHRCKKLIDAYQQGKKIAAMLYHHADTSTFRYRCYNVEKASEQSAQWQSVYFFMNELDQLQKLLPCVHVLVLTRLKWEHGLDFLVEKAHARKVPVLYDVDDLVCNVQYLKLVTNTLNVHFGHETDYDFWFSYISRQEYLAAMADGFITTNDFLGHKLSERFGKPYSIIVNSLNAEQVSVSNECVRQKRLLKSRNPFEIGYFSGTPSHINDFKVVAPEITQLLQDCPGINLRVVGFMEFPQSMQPLIQAGRVQFSPLVDFLELQRLIAQVDVNIVPLVENTFTNCKSELKFFEASAVNTITVATPTFTYRNAIEHGKTGFLCKQGQWYDCLKSIYEQKIDANAIVKQANAYCLNTYHGQAFVEQIEQAYAKFL